MVTVGGYEIDVAVLEEPIYDAEVTQYPVEQGADLADHVQARPVILQLEGLISDTPIGDLRTRRESGFEAVGDAGSGDMGFADAGYYRLKEIFEKREPVRVTTQRWVFEDMILQTLSTPWAAGDGDALKFNATFVQLRFAKAKRETVVVEVRAKTKGDLGNVAMSEAQVRANTEAAIKAYRAGVDWLKQSLTPRKVAPPDPNMSQFLGNYPMMGGGI